MTLSRRRFLALSAASAAGGCARPRLTTPTPAALDGSGSQSLAAHAAVHGLYFGCAVNVPLLATDAAYAALVRAQAGIVVAENAMKWQSLRPTPDTFDFTEADAFVAFAESANLKLRGHTLCWHRQLPAWFAATATKANARALLTTHIAQVAGRYAGRMHSWDVVNEAIRPEDGRADGLRDSPWLTLVGDDYIETAFRAARAADPRALLTYNDSGLEGEDPASHARRVAVLVLLRRLVARRVPIDAFGLQSHLTAPSHLGEDRFGPGLMAFLAAVRQLGLLVFVTELDVSDRNLPADLPARDNAVARVYTSYLNLILKEPAVRVVMTWGLTDRHTSLNQELPRADARPQRPLPFGAIGGREDQPTAAFFAIRNAFDVHPRSDQDRGL